MTALNTEADMLRTTRSVRYLGLHMEHHAAASGYDQLGHVRHGEYLPISENPGFLMRLVLRALRSRITNCGNQWYNRSAMHTELSIMRRSLKERSEIVHFLYGENSFRFAGLPGIRARRRNNRLVATYHTPVHRLETLVRQREHLKSLDAIVVMSNCQRPFFENLVPDERVHFVPHGINTNYFAPLGADERQRLDAEKEELAPSFKCITVGHHLRDYEVLAEVAKRCTQEKLNVEFLVVAWPDRVGPVANLPNVTCLTGISDEELLRYYQTSDLLMLPLLDATANNTLLEGMGCGLPVLSTDLQGVHDYAPEQILLAPLGDSNTVFEHLRSAMSGDIDLDEMAKSSRRRAEALSWESVRDQLDLIYQKIQ